MLKGFKYILNRVGACLSRHQLIQIQTLVNYLALGQWMKAHGFAFPNRGDDRPDVWSEMAKRVESRQVLYLEFGVARGRSMRWWSQALKHPNAMLHGFDSFEGLPEEGGPWRKGEFDTKGQIPVIDDSRVKFFPGWFDKTLPTYVVPPHEALIINLDADLYSSTIYVLKQLRSYLKPGTLVYFDEMNHLEHEPRAFDEFVTETGLRFRPLAADKTLAFVCFEIVG